MLMLCVMLALQRTGTSAKNPGGKGVKRKCSICSGAHFKTKCPTLMRDQQQCSAAQDGIGDGERMAREDADCVAYGAPLEREDGEDADEPKAPPEGSSRCPSLKPDECSPTRMRASRCLSGETSCRMGVGLCLPRRIVGLTWGSSRA